MIRTSAMKTLGQIGRLQAVLERLAYVPRRTAELAAPEIDKLVQRQFREGTDPYGRPWRPLRPATLARGRKPPPLTDTRALRSETRVVIGRASYAGVRVRIGAPYGYFHQVGYRNARTGKRVVARRILPQFGLPASWRTVLASAAKQAAREARRGR